MYLILAFTILGLACVFLVAIFNPTDGIEGQGIGRFLGRFHPLVLHFPVTCLVLAGLFEFTGRFGVLAPLKRSVFPLLCFAAFSSILTVILGLMLATNEGHQGGLIDRHRTLGISVSVITCLSLALFVLAKTCRFANLFTLSYRLSLISAILVMSLAAHDGGSLVHGPNYLAEYAPDILKPILRSQSSRVDLSDSGQQHVQSDNQHFISQATRERFDSDVAPFIANYCERCHGESKQEGNLRMDSFDPSFVHFSSQYDWEKVLGVLGSHRMPPENAKQPSERQRAIAIDWLHQALEEYAYTRRAEMANAPLRRLNKRELDNTYQDLFNVDSDFVSRLPNDPRSAHGYDNEAALLMIAMSDMKNYHQIARQAIQRYVIFGETDTSEIENYFVELEDVYHFGRAEGNNLAHDRAAQPLSISEVERRKQLRIGKPIVYRNRQYGPLPFGDIPQGQSVTGEGRGFARLHEQFMLVRTTNQVGEVVVKVHAAKTNGQGIDNSVPRLRLEAGWRNEQSLRVQNVGEFDITASLEQPETVEFRFRLEDVIAPDNVRRKQTSDEKWLLLVLSNVARHEQGVLAASIDGQSDLTLASATTLDEALINQAKKAEKQHHEGEAQWQSSGVPLLLLDALEASIIPTKANAAHPWFVASMNENSSMELEIEHLSEILSRFLPKVFRKNNVSQHSYAAYFDLYKKLRRQGDDYQKALSEVLAAALISPEFLYIGYSVDGDESATVESYDNNYLASRLSYYLWSSMPDQQLRWLASNGKLTDPAVLASEVERMLEDKRANRFIESFALQWLQLDKIQDVGVSAERYPLYGAELSLLSVKQSINTFKDNFHNNRDARELYFSDYMMLNKQLAQLYQVPEIESGEFARVKLEQYPPRLGLMTHASVLTMNSDGEDSHPIKRGVWLLERLLNDPPPPPPPSVPELDPNNPLLAGLSLKQKIEHHRELSGCKGCHEKIDPWGILLENYDAIGQWRTKVDSSSILPDGTRVGSVTEFTEYLKSKKQSQLMKAIVHHMMIYALGRDLDILDEKEAEVIYSAFRASGYKLSYLVQAIVLSDAFTNRQQHSS